MDTYLMMLYVTLEQEECLKQVFLTRGWAYKKPDLLNTTDQVGGLSTPRSPFVLLSQTESSADDSNTTVPAPLSTGKRKIPESDGPTPRKSQRGRKLKTSSKYVTQFASSKKDQTSSLAVLPAGHEYSHRTVAPTATGDIHPLHPHDNIISEQVSEHSTSTTSMKYTRSLLNAPIASGTTVGTTNDAVVDQAVATTSVLPTDHFEAGTSMSTVHSFVDSTGVVNIKVETVDDEYEPNDQEEEEDSDGDEGMKEDLDEGGDDTGVTAEVEDAMDPDLTAAIDSAVNTVKESRKKKKKKKIYDAKCQPTKPAYDCDYCEMKFERKANRARHVKLVHHKERQFQCQSCDEMFGTNWNLKLHTDQHHSTTVYICVKCNKQFKVKHHFNQHTTICGGMNQAMRHRCSECDRSYTSKNNLKLHVNICHTDSKEPIICHVCGEEFTRPHSLSRHLKRTHGITWA